MWTKSYKDYPPDEPLVKEQRESNKGIIGCEMHDLNGWGNSLHQTGLKQKRKKQSLLNKMMSYLFGKKKHE